VSLMKIQYVGNSDRRLRARVPQLFERNA